jgi:hypothetical protein
MLAANEPRAPHSIGVARSLIFNAGATKPGAKQTVPSQCSK